ATPRSPTRRRSHRERPSNAPRNTQVRRCNTRHALDRAQQVGDRKAAEEIGAGSAATIRSWRPRARTGPTPPRSKRQASGDDADALLAQAKAACRAERRALRRVDHLLEIDANAARAASSVARDH